VDQEVSQVRPEQVDGDERSPDEIREDIEQTRHELGETVEALAAKTDVKARAHEKLDEVKHRLSGHKETIAGKASAAAPESAGQAAEQAKAVARDHPMPVAIAGAVLAGFILGRLTSR
jgi:ElaB/YqjD/DUF883 family membrane-anchored ribosome-binding protein